VVVRPDVVSVTVVPKVTAVLVTIPEPSTVNEPGIAVPVTCSSKVRTIVSSAVLAAVNVGATI